jgi:superfamily I DNA and/or RNA helicase
MQVFESHIITAIGEKTEHLILIGDHIQLRPSANVYTLAKHFNLDVSLFERLIKNKMPAVQLCVQHRSIPMISSLTHHFYDIPILNHESALNRPPIVGVASPLYFINHQHFEENVADGSSKRNSYEGMYALQLARYLVHQGYEKSEITILTTYMGQRQQIHKKLVSDFKDLKGIHTTVRISQREQWKVRVFSWYISRWSIIFKVKRIASSY